MSKKLYLDKVEWEMVPGLKDGLLIDIFITAKLQNNTYDHG